MTALVTGGTGFLGQALALALKAEGRAVRTLARGDAPKALFAAGVEHCRGDLRSLADVTQAVRGCDVVFHTAAKVSSAGQREDFEAINITGTDHVISACRSEGVPHLVFTSTPSVVFGHGDLEGVDESTPYPAHYDALYPQTKAEAERRVMSANDSELGTVCLRPHLIWGPGDTSLLPRLVERAPKLRRIGSGGQRIDVTFIDDAVRAHLLAHTALKTQPERVGGRTYFISGTTVETWPFIDQLLDAAGHPPLTRSVPRSVALAAAWMTETMHRWRGAPGEPDMTTWVVRELTSSHWFDISAARRDLGYEPQVSVESGLERLRAELRDHPIETASPR